MWGRNLHAALALADVSLATAAETISVSRKTLERTIRGERAPRPSETAQLARLLNVSEVFLSYGLGPQRQYATISEAAEHWRVSPITIKRLCDRWDRKAPGGLQYIRIGGPRGQVRIQWNDIRSYGREHR
jgi:transcriptional regulator with XRE-family HTH domain